MNKQLKINTLRVGLCSVPMSRDDVFYVAADSFADLFLCLGG
jgi:hypothetical protein